MSSFLKIEWTVLCNEKPALYRSCRGCRTISAFASTGKFRLNANGSRLDAWLIYRCRACGTRWNRPLFERRHVKSISRRQLRALQENDPVLAERLAREGAGLDGWRTDNSASFSLMTRIVSTGPACIGETLLVIRNPDLARVRLDQVLAHGLALPRKEVLRLFRDGMFRVREASDKAVRRPLPAELAIELRPRDEGVPLGILKRLIGSDRGESLS